EPISAHRAFYALGRSREQSPPPSGGNADRHLGRAHSERHGRAGRSPRVQGYRRAPPCRRGGEGQGVAAPPPTSTFGGAGRVWLRLVHDRVGGREDELRLAVDEIADEPRTGDAIDFHALARDPFHGNPPRCPTWMKKQGTRPPESGLARAASMPERLAGLTLG